MPVTDHFQMSAWRVTPHAVEVGQLALDGSDPTYGGSGVKLGPDVYECRTCGALTAQPAVHAGWHDNEGEKE